MIRYSVTRQAVNCGPCQTIYVSTADEANRAFDSALKAGAIFAEIYDLEHESQIRVEYPEVTFHRAAI